MKNLVLLLNDGLSFLGIRNLATDILSIWKDIVVDEHLSGKELVKQESEEKSLESKPVVDSTMAAVIGDPNIDMEAADEPYGSPASSSSRSYGEGKSAQNTNTHLKIKKSVASSSQPLPPQQLTKLGKPTSQKVEKLNRKVQATQKPMEKSPKPQEDQKNVADKKIVVPKRTHEAAVDAFSAALSGIDEAANSVPAKRPKTTVKTHRSMFRPTGEAEMDVMKSYDLFSGLIMSFYILALDMLCDALEQMYVIVFENMFSFSSLLAFVVHSNLSNCNCSQSKCGLLYAGVQK